MVVGTLLQVGHQRRYRDLRVLDQPAADPDRDRGPAQEQVSSAAPSPRDRPRSVRPECSGSAATPRRPRPSTRPAWTTATSAGTGHPACALSSPATITQLPGTWRGKHVTWLHRSTLSRSSTWPVSRSTERPPAPPPPRSRSVPADSQVSVAPVSPRSACPRVVPVLPAEIRVELPVGLRRESHPAFMASAEVPIPGTPRTTTRPRSRARSTPPPPPPFLRSTSRPAGGVPGVPPAQEVSSEARAYAATDGDQDQGRGDREPGRDHGRMTLDAMSMMTAAPSVEPKEIATARSSLRFSAAPNGAWPVAAGPSRRFLEGGAIGGLPASPSDQPFARHEQQQHGYGGHHDGLGGQPTGRVAN